MLKRILLGVLLVPLTTVLGQFAQYAPDLRWDSEVHTYIGYANPLRQATTVTMVGYLANGAALEPVTVDLPGFNRHEWAVTELFGTDHVAWMKLDSGIEVGAYVRFEFTDGKRSSLYPFSPVAGQSVWVPHIARDTDLFFTQTSIANVSDGSGEVFSHPFMDNPDDEGPRRIPTPAAVSVPGIDRGHEQITFEYESLYGEGTQYLQWDRVAQIGDMALTGVQHFGKKGSDVHQFASVQLARTPTSELMISHINRDRDNFWTGLVLINTLGTVLPVDIQSYLEDGSPFQHLYTELEPYQKHLFLINNTNELGLSDIATWFRVSSFEHALIGYEIFGSPDDRVMAGMEPAPKPSNMCILPYTPTTNQLWTGVGIINPDDEIVKVQVGGLDDSGNIVAAQDFFQMEPNAKVSFTVEDLFGEAANRITWIRIDTLRGRVSAFAAVGDRKRTHLASLQGVPNNALEGTIFMANFEFDEVESLKAQGWREERYLTEFEAWRPTLFMQKNYEAVSGFLHLGFDPDSRIVGYHPTHESLALIAPPVDIPNDANPYYISFYLRFVDPGLIPYDGLYGIVWREEGTQTWNWFGLSGEWHVAPLGFSLYHFEIEPKFYRDEVHDMTQWLPFFTRLPDSMKGKRIELGVFYHQETPQVDFQHRVETPIMFIDVLRIAAEPLSRTTFVLPGSGTFDPY